MWTDVSESFMTPKAKFTVEVEKNDMLPFLGTQLLNRGPQVETKVYAKTK